MGRAEKGEATQGVRQGGGKDITAIEKYLKPTILNTNK